MKSGTGVQELVTQSMKLAWVIYIYIYIYLSDELSHISHI